MGCLGSLLAAALSALSQSAHGWSQEGHMVTGAIVYEELRARDPRVLEEILQLMSQHPDRGAFAVAVGGATDETRARRLFMEMARWPDDIRKGVYDHPTWHYASKPLSDPHHPPPAMPADSAAGSAVQAFALNLSVARDPHAPPAERAVALCWVMHLVGDIHQPLHAADQYSAAYPKGDRGGNAQYVRDPRSMESLSLHWYWDQAVDRLGVTAESRAGQLRADLPRQRFAELQPPARSAAVADEFARAFSAWAAESYSLAQSHVYRTDLATSATESRAPPLTSAYVADSTTVAERRLILSSYRLADVLIAALGASSPSG